MKGGKIPSVNFGKGKSVFGATDVAVGGRLLRPEAPISLLTGATLTRAGDGTYWDDTGTLQTAGTDVLRQDHDPATGAHRGALVEEAATNQLTHSEDFSAWSGAASHSFTTTTGAPDGGNYQVVAKDSASVLTLPATASSSSYSYTIYYADVNVASGWRFVVRNTTTATNLLLAEVSSAGALSLKSGTGTVDSEDVGGGWTKAILIVTSGVTVGDDLLVYAEASADNGDSMGLWGAQLEPHGMPTSYIPTTGTAATRPDDVLTASFSDSYGTIHLVGEHVGGDGVLWQSDNTTENSRMRVDVSGGNVRLVVDDGGVNQVTLTAGALASNGKYDLAFRFAPNDFAISLDGAPSVAITSGTVPTVTTGRFGSDTSGPTGRNWYKTSDYRTALLSDSQLEALTA